MKKKLAKRTLKPAPKKPAAAPAKKQPASNPPKKKLAAAPPKKNEALTDKIAAVPVAPPYIECRLVVGELSAPVDASDLCHTLGSGESGYGKGLVDAYPDAIWVGLLAHLGLPAFPLDRTVAAGPVKRLVQRLWYQAVGTSSGVSQKHAVELSARRPADTASEERYKQEFPNVVQAMSEKVERGRALATTLRAARPAAAEQTITVVAKENPYKVGSKAAATFELFAKAKTTSKFLELAAADKSKYEVGYLRYSSRDGYIKLT
jgi:hypothetical protein